MKYQGENVERIVIDFEKGKNVKAITIDGKQVDLRDLIEFNITLGVNSNEIEEVKIYR